MKDPSKKLGALTGLRSEVMVLNTLAAQSDVILEVKCSAANTARSQILAQQLVNSCPGGVLSFGLAGALDPMLESGTLLVPNQVVDEAGNAYRCHPDWCGAFRSALKKKRNNSAIGASMIGCDNIISQHIDKKNVFEKTGAVAVDMESHVLGAAAQKAGVPFLVVRAVADTARRDLPKAALLPLGPEGRPQIASLLAHLLGRPWEVPALLRLASQSHHAHRALRSLLPLAPALFRRL